MVTCKDNLYDASLLYADDSTLYVSHATQSPMLCSYLLQQDAIVKTGRRYQHGNGTQ